MNARLCDEAEIARLESDLAAARRELDLLAKQDAALAAPVRVVAPATTPNAPR